MRAMRQRADETACVRQRAARQRGRDGVQRQDGGGTGSSGSWAAAGVAGGRMQGLYLPVLTSGLLAGALPSRTRVAAIGPDRRWFIDWMVNEAPTAPRCTAARPAGSRR